jgi:hypothetical protein
VETALSSKERLTSATNDMPWFGALWRMLVVWPCPLATEAGAGWHADRIETSCNIRPAGNSNAISDVDKLDVSEVQQGQGRAYAAEVWRKSAHLVTATLDAFHGSHVRRCLYSMCSDIWEDRSPHWRFRRCEAQEGMSSSSFLESLWLRCHAWKGLDHSMKK